MDILLILIFSWVEVWLRKRRQYICKDEAQDSYLSLDTCRHADDDLRTAKCANKNNNSLVEILKSDIECGWSSSHTIRPFATIILSILIAVVVF